MEPVEILREEDTIVAIATPPGQGGIGIVRLSGELAPDIMQKLFKPASGSTTYSHRYLHYGWITDPKSDERVDEIMAVWMKAPSSYTREDVVEFQCHSGPALLNRVVSLCIEHGARLADPGEFTRRAYLNGRIDLLQAEAVNDLTSARSFTSGRLAMNMLQGFLGKEIKTIQVTLLDVLANIEASIDYPDESEEISSSIKSSQKLLQEALVSLKDSASGFERGKIWREGVRVVIVGRPNAGKSSLLNTLSCEDRAIVTHMPGTTRDTLDIEVNFEGIPVRLTDTAGIRSNPDIVESIGISRVDKMVDEAAMVLWLVDVSSLPDSEDMKAKEMLEQRNCLQKTLLVLNKIDCLAPQQGPESVTDLIKKKLLKNKELPHALVSAKTGEGLTDLISLVAAKLRGEKSEPPSVAPNFRQMDAISRAKNAVEQGLYSLREGLSPELATIDIREAYDILGGISGEDMTQDILDHIFSNFCLGK